MKDLINDLGTTSMPSVLSDPFKKECVTSIYIHYSLRYNGKWSAIGAVEFVNGGTEGRQKFEGDTFDEVVIKIKAFIENDLKK